MRKCETSINISLEELELILMALTEFRKQIINSIESEFCDDKYYLENLLIKNDNFIKKIMR